ncbi:long-chain fatty acid transporter, partial [Pseudoalteromonas rubra]
MNTVLRALMATGLMVVSSQSLAAAFQLAEQNVSGLGRAYAGEASAADDASVVARNPALMSQFQGIQVSAAAMYVEPDVSLQGTSTNNGLPANLLDDDSIAPSAVVPAVFMTGRLNDQWSVGAGVYSQFGLATEFDKDYAAGQLAGDTEIVTINTGVSVAYEIDPQWTLALGLNHVYADAKVVRHLGANPLQAPASTEVVNLEGDDSGYGWNLGLSYQIDTDNRLGFHYRSETDITFDGHFSNQLPASFGGTNGVALPGTLELTLPAMAEISGTHKLTEPMTLHYSVLWTGWNSFQ